MKSSSGRVPTGRENLEKIRNQIKKIKGLEKVGNWLTKSGRVRKWVKKSGKCGEFDVSKMWKI